MKQRGRPSPSIALLPIIPGRGPAVPGHEKPPEPPDFLPEDVRATWIGIASRYPADFFEGCEHLFELYCSGLVVARTLHRCLTLAAAAEPGGKRHLELVRVHRDQTALLANLAGKLRLSPRSQRGRQGIQPVRPGPAPWDFE